MRDDCSTRFSFDRLSYGSGDEDRDPSSCVIASKTFVYLKYLTCVDE